MTKEEQAQNRAMSEDDPPHENPVTTGGDQAPQTAPRRPHTNGATVNGGGGGRKGGDSTEQSKVGTKDADAEQGRENHEQEEERSLRDVCKDIHDRVERFLRVEPPAGAADGDVIRRTQKQTRISQGVIQRALVEYGYEHLSFSYNGGKDCLVLLLLYLSALWTHFAEEKKNRLLDQAQEDQKPISTHTDTSSHTEAVNGGSSSSNGNSNSNGNGSSSSSSSDFPSTIASIYAEPPDPFPAVTSFVTTSSRAYHLSLTHIRTNPRRRRPSTAQHQDYNTANINGSNKNNDSNDNNDDDDSNNNNNNNNNGHASPETESAAPVVSFRDAFAQYLDQHSPRIKAIFVGTRRTDPHGHNLTFFDLTDGAWPRFMRVHPVLEWRLDEIWCFLRSRELGSVDSQTGQWRPLDYCSMYDEGYTSLGGTGDTLRNPRLKVVEPGGGVSWRPAYQMVDDERERDGRE